MDFFFFFFFFFNSILIFPPSRLPNFSLEEDLDKTPSPSSFSPSSSPSPNEEPTDLGYFLTFGGEEEGGWLSEIFPIKTWREQLGVMVCVGDERFVFGRDGIIFIIFYFHLNSYFLFLFFSYLFFCQQTNPIDGKMQELKLKDTFKFGKERRERKEKRGELGGWKKWWNFLGVCIWPGLLNGIWIIELLLVCFFFYFYFLFFIFFFIFFFDSICSNHFFIPLPLFPSPPH